MSTQTAGGASSSDGVWAPAAVPQEEQKGKGRRTHTQTSDDLWSSYRGVYATAPLPQEGGLKGKGVFTAFPSQQQQKGTKARPTSAWTGKGPKGEGGRKGRSQSGGSSGSGKQGKGPSQRVSPKGQRKGKVQEEMTGRNVRSRTTLDISPGPPRPSRAPGANAEGVVGVAAEEQAQPCRYRDVRLLTRADVEQRSLSPVQFLPLEAVSRRCNTPPAGRGAYLNLAVPLVPGPPGISVADEPWEPFPQNVQILRRPAGQPFRRPAGRGKGGGNFQ